MISVIGATRQRPLLCKRMYDSARATQTNENRYEFYVDSNDPTRGEYQGLNLPIISSVPMGAVIADNLLAIRTSSDTLIVGDDAVFKSDGWDVRFEEEASKFPDGIYIIGCNDGRGKEGAGHFLVGRGWKETLGYVLSPIFIHWNVDVWTIEIAKRLGRYVFMEDVLLDHLKPHEIGESDDTSRKLRQPGVRERDSYVYQTCKHFQAYEEKALRHAIDQHM